MQRSFRQKMHGHAQTNADRLQQKSGLRGALRRMAIMEQAAIAGGRFLSILEQYKV